jgi:hypothetical protein
MSSMAPTTGTAVPSCDPDDGCTLLCTDDADCPAGMDCFSLHGVLSCLWQPDAC